MFSMCGTFFSAKSKSRKVIIFGSQMNQSLIFPKSEIWDLDMICVKTMIADFMRTTEASERLHFRNMQYSRFEGSLSNVMWLISRLNSHRRVSLSQVEKKQSSFEQQTSAQASQLNVLNSPMLNQFNFFPP